MLKAEKYKERIKELDYSFALCKGEIKNCQIVDCESCEFGETSGCTAKKIKWLLEEYKEPLLTEKEKAYLKNVIEPLGVEVRYIKKWKSIYIEENKCCYNIAIAVKHPIIETWERDLMNFAVTKEMPFNRLELDKRYSLKDLGL